MHFLSLKSLYLKANFECWTEEEDMKLLQIVKIKGDKNWRTIAKDFPNRTRSQCRQRFHIIFKSFQKFRNFTLRELHYSDADSRQKKRQDELYRRLHARVSDFLQVHNIKNEAIEEIEEEYYVNVPHLRPSDIHETPDGVSVINSAYTGCNSEE